MTGPGYIDINNDPAALGTFFTDKKPDTAQPNTFSHTQQQGAQQIQQSISYDGADPAYISRMEQFEGITHEEIYRNAQAMSPGVMHQQADTWISIADTLSGGLLGAQLSIQKALTSGMEGKTADAALAAAQKFYQQASDVQEVINSCGHRIKAAAHAAEVVKASVPPPAAPQSGTGAPSTVQPAQIIISAVAAGLAGAEDSDQVAYQRGVEALYRTAIDTMNNNYKPSYGPAGDGIPTFVPVQAPGGEPGGDTGGTGGTGAASTGGTNNSGASGTGDAGEQGTQEPSPTDPDATQTAGVDSNSTGAQQSSTNRTPESATNPASTTSTSPVAATTSPGTRSMIPGSTTAAPGGSSGPGSGSPGRTISGLPVGASTAAATTGSAATNATTGRSGMPGMMSPGAGKKDDTESNRKTPDYLIGDHEEELLGPHTPMVPQVIGDDALATQHSHNQDQRR